MQEGGSQQVRIAVTRIFQPYEHPVRMDLFERLHPLKQDDLGRFKIRQESFGLHPLAGSGDCIPKLAGTVSEAGRHEVISTARVTDKKGL
jgi:hypothetical protein